MAQKESKEMRRSAEIVCVALGNDIAEAEVVEVVDAEPATLEEKVDHLEKRMFYLTNAMDSLFTTIKELSDKINRERDNRLGDVIEAKKKENKVEIPEGTVLTGKTKGLSYFLHTKNGGFYVGITKYDSLSAAAEGISGVRRSGWTFWKLPDGKTVKEAFKG